MKEKTIAKEVKAKFGIEIGNRGMIMKNINHPTTRFVTKLMAYKLLRKSRKEEAPARVVVAATQCTKGTVLSWASYLLNLFLEYCRDVQDGGTEFHYSWILILISLDA